MKLFFRYSLLLLALNCLNFVSQAQLKLGPSIGLSIIDIDVNNDLFQNGLLAPPTMSKEIGVDYGAVIRYDISDKYSVKMLSFYSERKYTQSYSGAIGHFTILFNQFNTSLNFSYQPIKSFHTEIGLDHIFINSASEYYSSPQYATKYEVNRNDFGILAGVAYSIVGFEFTLNYRLGLWAINAEHRLSFEKYKPFDYLRLSAAYLFDLNFKKA